MRNLVIQEWKIRFFDINRQIRPQPWRRQCQCPPCVAHLCEDQWTTLLARDDCTPRACLLGWKGEDEYGADDFEWELVNQRTSDVIRSRKQGVAVHGAPFHFPSNHCTIHHRDVHMDVSAALTSYAWWLLGVKWPDNDGVSFPIIN